jgi:hypothetical protein
VNDQHVTAIATIVQDVLLLASAGLIAWYLWETRKMRKASESQVSKSQELVEAAQRQIVASLEQVEAAFRPAVVARDPGNVNMSPSLENIGNGPAIEVRWSIPDSNWRGLIPCLQSGQPHGVQLNVGGMKALYNAGLASGNNIASIECSYRSLSGRWYSSSCAYDFERSQFVCTFAHGEAAGPSPKAS